ncbi:MAG: CDP-glucose 4,6-dehydratase [Planctomycetota bacterium]|nr:CDP-glucose 4,6-dehydratase [Planctomycetota bacterium]
MLSQYFKDKSVLVTGHTGFKGSWLCLWLHRLGAKVSGLSLEPPTTPNHFSEANIVDLLDFHILADIRDEKAVGCAIEESQPDLILHLAAQTIVRRGYREPLETFSTNVMGTACVLEAIRLAKRPCSVVVVTSDKCYDNREQVWGYRETDPMGEKDPYGSSKGAAELVVRSYRDSYFPVSKIAQHGIKVASARAGNVIGGGDWTEDALIVDVIKALSIGEPVLVRNPNAFRPWNHVLQALSGYLTLSARLMTSNDPAYCSGWNIGPLPGNEIPVREVVELLLDEWGEGSWIDGNDPSAPREAGILRLSIDKALWELNWKPCWDVRESIRQTAKWYRHRQGNEGSMHDFSLSQIIEYEDAMRLSMAGQLVQPNSFVPS